MCPEVRFDHIVGVWEDGQRRLRAAEPRERAAMDRVTDAIVSELQRQLGGKFTAQELAGYYLEVGTDWCFEIAMRAAPATPAAWDMATVAGAAFARYVRRASDFGGGRQLQDPDVDS